MVRAVGCLLLLMHESRDVAKRVGNVDFKPANSAAANLPALPACLVSDYGEPALGNRD